MTTRIALSFVLLFAGCALDMDEELGVVSGEAQGGKGSGDDVGDTACLHGCECPDPPIYYTRDQFPVFHGADYPGTSRWHRVPEPADQRVKRWVLITEQGDADLFVYNSCGDASPDCTSETALFSAPEHCVSTGSIARVDCIDSPTDITVGHSFATCIWELVAELE